MNPCVMKVCVSAAAPATPSASSWFLSRTGSDPHNLVGTPEHQGWNGVIHGGLLATLLDETMSQWLWARNIVTMTAEMTTRYRTATPVGVKLTIEARRVAERGRLLQMEAWVKLPDGTVSARATAKFLKVKPEKMPKGALSFEHE